ncbi:DUF3021 family protein [Exiguobacterium sp. IPCH1]|uniref:DUF3021 family protein n=1 Tax=Exiguobacterium sp. IPCI3 TaxID=2510948 RepID=UPI00103DF52A|nr:DUF3021 family protein [Exiguobacterium sp. IPCI3]TCI67202.1 DUF3021 family protein [Exiguobacterium sp. IPCI3]TCI76660.1 DUF3021 family protein [Exiguobacterium sp. IPCH1]TCI78311.1 DUF3021 family protein [Exiguobacterium sp. IPBC4]
MVFLKRGLVRGVTWFAVFGVLATYQWWSGDPEGAHNMLVYGGMAFFLGLTSVIYEVRRWSFPKQIFIHWATMHVTILPLVIFSGFLPVTSLQDALLTYLKFNVSGLILFTLSRILLKIRRQVKAS